MAEKSAERLEFLHDVLSTALEGGVGYWSVADNIERSGTPEERKDYRFNWHYISVKLFCSDGGLEPIECTMAAEDDLIETCTGHYVDEGVIAKGIGIATGDKEDIGLHRDYRKEIWSASRENWAGEIDASLADSIVQLGIFGKVIFG